MLRMKHYACHGFQFPWRRRPEYDTQWEGRIRLQSTQRVTDLHQPNGGKVFESNVNFVFQKCFNYLQDLKMTNLVCAL